MTVSRRFTGKGMLIRRHASSGAKRDSMTARQRVIDRVLKKSGNPKSSCECVLKRNSATLKRSK